VALRSDTPTQFDEVNSQNPSTRTQVVLISTVLDLLRIAGTWVVEATIVFCDGNNHGVEAGLKWDQDLTRCGDRTEHQGC